MQTAGGLVPDEPVPDHECWYRLLTNTDYITKDRTVHYQALKGKAFRPPEQAKPWAHELSGSLSFIVDDISAQGEAAIKRIRMKYIERGEAVPTKIRFTGVACAAAYELRALTLTKTDVVYSPLPTNAAHSNFVTYTTVLNEDLDPIRDRLMLTLRVIEPHELGNLIGSCGQSSGVESRHPI